MIEFGTNKLSHTSVKGDGSAKVITEHDLHIPFSAFDSIVNHVYSSELIFEPQDYFSIASEASFYMIDDHDRFYADLTEKFQQMITAENSKQLLGIAKSYGNAFLEVIEYISNNFWDAQKEHNDG